MERFTRRSCARYPRESSSDFFCKEKMVPLPVDAPPDLASRCAQIFGETTVSLVDSLSASACIWVRWTGPVDSPREAHNRGEVSQTATA
jgi:hypothetical protein